MWPHSQQGRRPAASLQAGTQKPRKRGHNSNLLAGAHSCPNLHLAAACPKPCPGPESPSVHLLGVQTLFLPNAPGIPTVGARET